MSLVHPLLTSVPDFARPPKRGESTMHDRTAFGPAEQTVYFPQTRPDQLFNFRFAFELALPIQTLKEFFRDRAGRTHPFYMPSWQKEITLAADVASGIKLIPIVSVDEDFEATHLDQAADHYGRQIFFYKDGQVVFAQNILRVLPGDNPGEEILDIDNPLPFAIDEDTVVGFCHLVRFGDDRLEWKHWLPDHAEVEVSFRGMRGVNLNTITQPIAEIDQYGQLGFESCVLAPGEPSPVTNRVGYAYGPDTLHNTQDDPFSRNWAAWPASDGVRMRYAPPPQDVIWLPNQSGQLTTLFSGAITTDHISLAFDQDSFEVIAYQLTAGTIEIRRFFNSAVEIVSFPGIDPVLQFNGLLDANLDTGDTDVVVYYVKPGDNALWMRFQRDNFDTEYLASLLPGRPMALKRAYFVYDDDLLGGRLHVEFIDAGFRVCDLVSVDYPDPPPPPPPPPEVPIDLAEAATGSMALRAGLYSPAVVYWDGGALLDAHPPLLDAGTGTMTVSGLYTSVIVYSDGEEIDATHPPLADDSGATFLFSGTHLLGVIESPDLSEAAESSMRLSGVYALNVIPTPSNEETGFATFACSGVYEPA